MSLWETVCRRTDVCNPAATTSLRRPTCSGSSNNRRGSRISPPPTREEHDGVLFCPETGTLMTRWKIGHGFSFAIDRSITGGIWLDRGEWEALEARNFHDEIHLVFTAPWQKQVRSAHSQETYLATLKSTLGTDLVGQVSALRETLQNHPHRSMALAYLMSQ